MAGDCPHSARLEASLKHYHDSSPIISATHATYLKMIGELKNELEHISTEVVKVQTECNSQDREGLLDDDGGGLATSLKELETQNDRLQQALKETIQSKDAALTEMQANNDTFKGRIQHLSNLVMERDEHIEYLTAMLNQYSSRHQLAKSSCSAKTIRRGPTTSECCVSVQTIAELEKRVEKLSTELDQSKRQENLLHTDIRKLNEELNESTRKHAETVAKGQRIAGLLRKQEDYHTDFEGKYAVLEKDYNSQIKKLKAATLQLKEANDKIVTMEKSNLQINMEREFLRDEVMSLKEKETAVVSSHRNLQDLLAKTRKELEKAHEVIVDQRNVMERTENAHAEVMQRVLAEHSDAKRKLNAFLEDHQRLLKDHQKEKEVIKQYEVLLNSYRQWKQSQLKADTETRQKLQEYEALLRTEYDEHQKCEAEKDNLYRDYLIIQAELESARKDAFKNVNYLERGSTLYDHSYLAQSFSERSLAERIEVIRRTIVHLSQQNASLQAQIEARSPPSARRLPSEKTNENSNQKNSSK